MDLKELGRKYKRIAIVGGPGSGKTFVSRKLDRNDVFSTDQAMDLPWSEQVTFWMNKLLNEEAWVLEGVQAARVLRKGLQADCVIRCTEKYRVLHPRQEAMGRAINTVFQDILNRGDRFALWLYPRDFNN